MVNLLCYNLTCSFLECIGEACVPRGPSHLLFLFLPTWSWILILPLPPLSLFLKASFVAAHLLHDSAACATFGWKIELHHQPTTIFKLKRPLLPYSLIQINLPTHLVFSPCFKACNQLCWDAGPSSIPHWALSLSGHNTEPADCWVLHCVVCSALRRGCVTKHYNNPQIIC